MLPGESAEVTSAGADQLSIHALAENTFYREETADFLIAERYETHTLAVGYRRGFRLPGIPAIELGGQVQLHERDNGVLNGFIVGFEDLFASVTGRNGARNGLRIGAGPEPPLGSFVTRNGVTIYQSPGAVSGFGDISLVAKALVAGSAPASRTRVAVRVALNVSQKSEFTAGNYAGVGVSFDRRLSRWAALHADTHATIILDRMSQWQLPLQPVTFGFSIGPELRLTRTTSIGLQYDGNTTPYKATGTNGLDKGYGDIALGAGHDFPFHGRRLTAQAYGRENMNLPFYVRWNTDPDFSVGLKLTIH